MTVSTCFQRWAPLGAAVVLLAAMWCFYLRWDAWNNHQLRKLGFASPHICDIYSPWYGARELLLRGRNPYSLEVTREIQMGIYGRPLQPGRPGEPIDQQRFAYPLYVAVLLAPFVLLPFPAFQLIWIPLLVASALGSIVLWLRTLDWRPSCRQVLLLITFILGSLPFVEALELNQLSIVVGLLLSLTIWLFVRERFVFGGAVLALATIKPQLSLPLIACTVLWTVGDWRKRRGLVAGFAGAMLALAAISWWLLPGWIGSFLTGLRAYSEYKQSMSMLQAITGRLPGTVLALAAGGWLGVETWRRRTAPADSSRLQPVIAAVLAWTAATAPSLAAYTQVIVVPAVILLLRERSRLWQIGAGARVLLRGAILVVAWEWAAALLLAVLPQELAWRWILAPFLTSPLVPVAILCCVLLLLSTFPASKPAPPAVTCLVRM